MKGKSIILAGGSGGLGASVAELLAERGAIPIIGCKRNRERADALAKTIFDKYQVIAPVVVGVDGSPASELATAIAFDEASRRKAELVAVHTWMNHADFYVDVAWDAVATQAEEELAQRLAGWSERYPEVIVRRVVGQDNPVSRLLKESSRAQLLVVGSHGRGGFAGLLLGSVSSALAHASRIPVIVARS